MTSKKTFTLLALITASNFSIAAEAVLTKEYTICMDKAAGGTLEMKDCISAEFSKQDNRLNTIYKEQMASLPENQKSSLKHAQRTWIKLRDSECKSQSKEEEGGTLEGIIYGDCVLQKTAIRADEIKAIKVGGKDHQE
jgi:uncharacterized protein YecT (DUF1311 family)